MIQVEDEILNDKTVETAPDTVEIKIIVFIIVHHTSAKLCHQARVRNKLWQTKCELTLN